MNKENSIRSGLIGNPISMPKGRCGYVISLFAQKIFNTRSGEKILMSVIAWVLFSIGIFGALFMRNNTKYVER